MYSAAGLWNSIAFNFQTTRGIHNWHFRDMNVFSCDDKSTILCYSERRWYLPTQNILFPNVTQLKITKCNKIVPRASSVPRISG